MQARESILHQIRCIQVKQFAWFFLNIIVDIDTDIVDIIDIGSQVNTNIKLFNIQIYTWGEWKRLIVDIADIDKQVQVEYILTKLRHKSA